MKPTILICGQTGTGKSSIVNFRLREPVARVGNSAESVRNGFPPPKYQNDSVIFYDSDGYEIGEKQIAAYQKKLLGFLSKKTGQKGIHAVWYTINGAGHRITGFDAEMVAAISENFQVCVLITKIDELSEAELTEFQRDVKKRIKKTKVFHVSTIKGSIQAYTDWDAVVKWTIGTLNSVVQDRRIAQKLQKLTKKAYVVIEDTHLAASLSAAIPIPLLDSAVLVPILSGMVTKILAVYKLSLSDNVVVHVIKSIWAQILGKTAVRSGLKLIPFVGWFASAAAGGVGNVLIVNSLGEATIDLCNDYLFEEWTAPENKRSFEDIFTSGKFASVVKEHMENKDDTA
jgi:uncharacterized protein (DUF697 family)/GTP-binding protein EngB required for normal cell division